MVVIIPARYSSTRLPGKALQDINGKPLVQHVYECAARSTAKRIIIATDNTEIRDTAQNFGAEVCMTSDQHNSGTERLAEVISLMGLPEDEIVVNLQGDEPLMPVSIINQVADQLASSGAPMATACHEITDRDEILDPNVVKVIFDEKGNAIYFSRSVIPHLRGNPELVSVPGNTYYRHIGIYSYRAGFIKQYISWQPCELEKQESLEQLRVLWHGEKISVCISGELPGPGVDTPADLAKVRSLITN